MQNLFRIVILFLIVLYSNNCVNAQKLLCKVKSTATKESLSYCSIYTDEYTLNYVTNEDGEFYLDTETLSEADTLNISRIGYLIKKITLKSLINDNGIIYIDEVIKDLSEVVVFSSKLTWAEVIYRALQTINIKSQSAIESEINRKISIQQNGSELLLLNLFGKSHDEGFDGEQIIQNRGLYSFNVYDSVKFIKKQDNIVPNYNGGKINGDTYFENRAIKFLFPIGVKYYNYALEGIEVLGYDTVYKISSTINPSYNGILNTIDKKMFNKFYSFIFSNKTYYINARTFEFVRIEFEEKLKRKISNNGTKLISVFGYCNFLTINGSIHPTTINISHSYENSGIQYLRNDIILYSNIKLMMLSNEELIKKYRLKAIANKFPARNFQERDDFFDTKSNYYFYGIKF